MNGARVYVYGLTSPAGLLLNGCPAFVMHHEVDDRYALSMEVSTLPDAPDGVGFVFTYQSSLLYPSRYKAIRRDNFYLADGDYDDEANLIINDDDEGGDAYTLELEATKPETRGGYGIWSGKSDMSYWSEDVPDGAIALPIQMVNMNDPSNQTEEYLEQRRLQDEAQLQEVQRNEMEWRQRAAEKKLAWHHRHRRRRRQNCHFRGDQVAPQEESRRAGPHRAFQPRYVPQRA
mgnify:CR=1 FL=1|tara:strand:- start:1174 stop:1869 length:696 start_codon:yes stop_codon:yes gene_type:complete